jgi:hypothetical protein
VYMGHGREGSYHIYNNVRTVGLGRAPGTAAGRRSQNPMERVPFVYPRMHEQISLFAEELHNIAKIDDPRARDEAGATFIKLQTKTLSQRAGNWRAALVGGMLRDSLYMVMDGDNWYPSWTDTGTNFRLNFQMPSGNTAQLNMTGDGSIIDVPWSNPSANIPLHLMKISTAFQELCGGRLGLVMCSPVDWQYIISNEYVASIAGIANPPFRTFTRQVGTTPEGDTIDAFVGELACAPGVEFFITAEGLEIGAPGSEAWTQTIPDGYAMFMVNPDSWDYLAAYQGSEPIAEYDGGPKSVKVGMASWSTETANPTSTNVFALDNVLCLNHVPNATAYARIYGF